MSQRDDVTKLAEILDQKKGVDIQVLDIGMKSSFADYLVLVSGRTERQVGALSDEVEEFFEKQEIELKSVEGKKSSGWILLDYGDIVVNVLTVEMRERYNMESLWVDCERIDSFMEEISNERTI